MPRGEFFLNMSMRAAGWYFRALPHLPWNRGLEKRLVRGVFARTPRRLVVKTLFGATMEVATDDFIGGRIAFFGEWEPAITHYMTGALVPGDIFVDVGANIGYHALLAAARVGRAGRVYAIEASPTVFGALEANIARNPFRTIAAFNCAAIEATRTVPVHLHDASNVGLTTVVAPRAAAHRHRVEAMVEGRTVADIVPPDALLAARLIKIDVEGAEWLVVQGLRDMLPRLPRNAEILIEVDRAAVAALGGSVEALVAIFREAGFVPWRIANTYSIAEHTHARRAAPVPLASTAFDAADLLFRRG